MYDPENDDAVDFNFNGAQVIDDGALTEDEILDAIDIRSGRAGK